MSKRYGGPLGWLRSWNFRRLEKRRWQRKLLEALADDDAAIMEALSRLMDETLTAEAVRASAQAVMENRLNAVAADLGARLDAGRGDVPALASRLDAVAADLGARLDAGRGDVPALASRLDVVAADLGARLDAGRGDVPALASRLDAVAADLGARLDAGRGDVPALASRLDAVAADLGAVLEAIRDDLAAQAVLVSEDTAQQRVMAAAVADVSARLAAKPDDRAAVDNQAAEHERLDQRSRAATVDSFPLIPTGRDGLVEPELELLAHLASRLASKLAIDVGAHHGKFSAALLGLGFEVHALEPNPPALAELERRLGGQPCMTIHAVAAGAEEGEATLGLVADASGRYSDATQFASLSGLPLPEGLVSAGSVRVPLRRLDALLKEHALAVPSVVKVDAEGYDLEVLRGLGALWPEVLIAEFWDDELPFSAPGARNRLTDLVAHARAQGARYHLVVFRRWGDDRPAFYANYSASPERSWGNVIFFKDPALCEEARRHLGRLLPEARFVALKTG